MPSWTLKTTAEEVATALQNQIRGKNVLVTGVGPKSLGAETVRVIAPYAKTIIIVSRTRSKIEETVAAVKAEAPSASFKIVILDLASLASVKHAATEVNALGIPIHVVVENAAVTQHNSLTRTAEGFEAQFGANHLGHFLFTSLILPSVRLAVKDAPDFQPRIVVVASSGHVYGDIRYDDPSFENPADYQKMVAYGQSKTANILFARLLAKKLAPENILVYSLHPGVILETGLGSAVSKEELQAIGVLDEQGNPLGHHQFKTLGEGTATQVIAAFDSALKDNSGSYLVDGVVANQDLADYAKDDESAEKLWVFSEQLLDYKFAV